MHIIFIKFNNILNLLYADIRGVRSHAKEYITSLNEQSYQFIDHFQGPQAVIVPFIDVEKEESGEEFDFDPRSRDCFADFAQPPEPSPQVNSLIRENANDMNGINEGVMSSPGLNKTF